MIHVLLQLCVAVSIEPLHEKQQRGCEREMIPVEAGSIDQKPGSDTPRNTVGKWNCSIVRGRIESLEYCEGSRPAPYLRPALV